MHNEQLNEKVGNLSSENVFDDFERRDGGNEQGEIREEIGETKENSEQSFVQPILPDGSLAGEVKIENIQRTDMELDMEDIYGSVNRVCEVYKDSPFLLNNEINRMSKEINSRNG